MYPFNTGAYDPNLYPEMYAPYGGLYESTSGPADDEEIAETIAEYASEAIAEETATADSQGYDTGAGMGIGFMGPAQIMSKVQGVAQMLGLGISGATAQKAAAKVPAKVPVKVQTKKAVTRPLVRPVRPPMRPLVRPVVAQPVAQPVMGPVATGRQPIKSIQELMQRVEWCQLANLVGAANGAVTLGIGATNIASVIQVTRSGWTFDWSTNLNTGFVLANSLTYEQLPNTIFAATPLSNWGPAAANPSPIEPIEVTFPATFAVNLTNINPAAAEVVTWQMSGIPRKGVALALRDPDVVAFLAARGWELAKAAQAGSWSF